MSRPVRLTIVVWAVSLLFAPTPTRAGLLVDALVAGAWLALLLAGSVEARSLRTACGALAGVALILVWVSAPAAYPIIAALFLTAIGWGAALGPGEKLRGRALVVAAAPALFPAALALFVWTIGTEASRQMLRDEWPLPSFSFAWWSVFLRQQALIVLAWLGLRLVAGERSAWTGKLVAAAGAIMAAAIAGRALTLASLLTLHADAGWSEAPLLLNLLKLRVGAPVYAPFESCNSYSYAPALELVHRTLLGPFGRDLSLLANRSLVVVWQLMTATILSLLLFPFVQKRVAKGWIAASMLLVATSSFLATNLHPDHLLMPWFALALGLALHARRLPERAVLAGLVILPAAATAVKMTGAGIGVGLALALGWPLARRRIAALGGGAALAVGVLALYERSFPLFLRYTVALQASHPIAWSGLWRLPTEAPARLTIVALLALGGSFVWRREEGARRDAVRVLLVTFGFMLPSLIAYLKVGGRVNSLLPLTIGSAVALARLAAAYDLPANAAWLAVWGALTITPPTPPVSSALRAQVDEHHARAIALVEGETRAGRRPLLYESTLAWIQAGRSDVPLDRWQSISELVMGNHVEANVCYARIASGAYDSVIVSDAALVPENPDHGRLGATLARHFEVDGSLDDGETLQPLRVYRWRR